MLSLKVHLRINIIALLISEKSTPFALSSVCLLIVSEIPLPFRKKCARRASLSRAKCKMAYVALKSSARASSNDGIGASATLLYILFQRITHGVCTCGVFKTTTLSSIVIYATACALPFWYRGVTWIIYHVIARTKVKQMALLFRKAFSFGKIYLLLLF